MVLISFFSELTLITILPSCVLPCGDLPCGACGAHGDPCGSCGVFSSRCRGGTSFCVRTPSCRTHF